MARVDDFKTFWFISFMAGGTMGNAFVEHNGQFINIRNIEKMLEEKNPIGGYRIVNYKQISTREYLENVNQEKQ